MCAIVDASVANEVFSTDPPQAGLRFVEWIDTGRGQLVATGKLLEELNKTLAREWIQQAFIAGLIKDVSESDVEAKTEELQNKQVCTSDDPHVIALAQVSGARLLYSHDRDLQKDFKNKRLIDQPRGKVYSTIKNKKLLGRKDLCRVE